MLFRVKLFSFTFRHDLINKTYLFIRLQILKNICTDLINVTSEKRFV